MSWRERVNDQDIFLAITDKNFLSEKAKVYIGKR